MDTYESQPRRCISEDKMNKNKTRKQINEISESERCELDKPFYAGTFHTVCLNFINGSFVLRRDPEHKHFYGKYSVKPKHEECVFDILDIQYDMNTMTHVIIVHAMGVDSGVAFLMSANEGRYFVEKDNQLVFPAKDLYLLRDDRILDGQILKKGDT